MIRNCTLRKKVVFLLFHIILTCLLSLAIYRVFPTIVIGNDFYVFQSASKAFFNDGISPYSDQVAIANQLGVYGRTALTGENLLTFSYPPYALIPFIPLSFLPLKWAQSIWMAFLFSSSLVLPLVAYPRIPRWAIITAFTFYPISFSLILGNYAILIGSILILVVGYLFFSDITSSSLDIFSGVLLAFCTIKPQFSALFILFILLFALHSKHWRFILSFIIGFLVFIAFSFILLPTWPVEWYYQLFKYVDSNQAIPHVTIFLQRFMHESSANIFSIVISSALFLVLGWLFWKWWKKEYSLLKILVFIGFLTYFIHPRTVSYEQITFLVPFLIWIFSNSPSTSTITKLIFYFSAIVISWAGFFAAKAGWAILFPLEWIFAFYLIWMVYIYFTPTPPTTTASLQLQE